MPVEWSPLGLALAKVVAKLVLRDTPVSGVSAELIDVVASGVPDRDSQRALVRTLEHIGDRVRAELEPYFRAEYGGLPANEESAALLAVVTAFERAPLDRSALLDADLQPTLIEARVRAELNTQDLLPQACVFAEALLRETCVYVAKCAIESASMATYVGVEALRREREAFAAIDKAIERTPHQITGALGVEDPRRFELDYRRGLLRLDKLMLYGLPEKARPFKRYPLSVAYIALSAKQFGQDKHFEAPVDEVLSGKRRVVLRGEAGSGKTTLLQWLTIRAAERSFGTSLAAWNELVPLFVPLRRYAEHPELPSPSQLVDFSAGALAERVPPTWVHDLLKDGRALVLVDGLDELPLRLAPSVPGWLESLLGTYPNATYVISSRPAGVSRLDHQHHAFAQCSLVPMEDHLVTRFVDHWHHAVAAELRDPEDIARLADLRPKLDALLSTSQPLRLLMTNPLLCALVCALHHVRGGSVPRNRLSLYKEALEMLISRRDADRGLGDDELMDVDDAIDLLQEFAYWMLRNGPPTATRDQVISQFARRLQAMPGTDASAEEAYDHLLLRSGVLREPVEGEIDFIHLTFQEYLAGKAIAENDDWGALAKRHLLGRWRSPAVFAAGHANARQRAAFLEHLLWDDTRVDPETGQKAPRRERSGNELLARGIAEHDQRTGSPNRAPEIDGGRSTHCHRGFGRCASPPSWEPRGR